MGNGVQTPHLHNQTRPSSPVAATGVDSGIAWQLAPALEAAVEAGRAAHLAAAALTDTLAACQHLPADIYRHAPDVFQTARNLTAAARALNRAVHTATATATRTPDHLHQVHQAVNTLRHTTAAADVTAGALRTAATWYTAALPG